MNNIKEWENASPFSYNFGPRFSKYSKSIIKLLKYGIFSKVLEKCDEIEANCDLKGMLKFGTFNIFLELSNDSSESIHQQQFKFPLKRMKTKRKLIKRKVFDRINWKGPFRGTSIEFDNSLSASINLIENLTFQDSSLSNKRCLKSPQRDLLRDLVEDLIEEEEINRLNSDNTMKIKVTLAQNQKANQSLHCQSMKEDLWNSEHLNFSNPLLTQDVRSKYFNRLLLLVKDYSNFIINNRA